VCRWMDSDAESHQGTIPLKCYSCNHHATGSQLSLLQSSYKIFDRRLLGLSLVHVYGDTHDRKHAYGEMSSRLSAAMSWGSFTPI